jgi:predicted O-methyltransferase YrrM
MKREQLVKQIISPIENGIFVEIGTHCGSFADFILENNKSSKLYCVDPYIKYDSYDDAINNYTGDELFNDTYNLLKSKYGDRITFIRKFSEDAINDIPDNIDFLYIDGNHRYSYVYKDLELYFPKVKKNGYIIGDDAVDTNDDLRNNNGDVFINWGGENCYGNYGVIKAFREFCSNYNLNGIIIENQYMISIS